MNSLPSLIFKFIKKLHFECHFSAHSLRAYCLDLHQAYRKLGVPYFRLESDNISGININNLDFQMTKIRWDENLLLHHSIEAQTHWAHLAPSTRQRKSSTLKSFLNYLFEEGHIHHNLSSHIILPKVNIKIPLFISVDEVGIILKKLLTDIQAHPPESSSEFKLLLFLLLYGGGLRINEAVSLKWTQINFKDRSLRILGKGNKERQIIVPRLVITHLSRLSHVQQFPFVFGEMPLSTRKAYNWIRDMGIKAGLINHLHPHALRHSYATHLLNGGMNIRTLQELLGHESLNTTQKYIHLTINQLAQTLETHHPLSIIKKDPVS